MRHRAMAWVYARIMNVSRDREWHGLLDWATMKRREARYRHVEMYNG